MHFVGWLACSKEKIFEFKKSTIHISGYLCKSEDVLPFLQNAQNAYIPIGLPIQAIFLGSFVSY